MSSPIIIPIFPLGIVPLPGEPVPLHIFEPRYKQMISDSAPRPGSNEYQPIGINFAGENQLHEVGCTVVIHQILHKYADGQLDIMALAYQRYRLLAVQEDKSYLQAQVEFFSDQEPLETPDSALQGQVLEQFSSFVKLIGSESKPDLSVPFLSFHLAMLLSMEIKQRLALIEMRSENQRLKMLEAYLGELVPRLEQAREFKRRVRSNGHF
jgi:Lon protease-like protein